MRRAAWVSVATQGAFDENPLWLVVLSDLMTNLMLFFLVLYAFTRQPDEERKRMMEKLSSSFSGKKVETAAETKAAAALDKAQEQAAAEALKRLLDPKMADVIVNERQVRVRLNNPVYFASGSAALDPAAEKDLDAIGALLAAMPNEVLIEGHTDDVRIASGRYRTNWELSSARAASVRAYLGRRFGIPDGRFVIAGYGEFRPIASNATREGRLKNRRIELIVTRK